MRWIKQLQRRTPLGWLQLSHETGRLLVALSGIAFADVLMFMQLGFQNALYDSNTRVDRAMLADIVLLKPQRAESAKFVYLFAAATPASDGYSRSSNRRGVVYQQHHLEKPPNPPQCDGSSVGFDPDRPAFNLPEVNQQLTKIKLPDVVLFDRGARGKYAETIAQVDQGKPRHH